MIANRMRAFAVSTAFAILESNSCSCLGIRLPQSLATPDAVMWLLAERAHYRPGPQRG
jgi:hypothetical protein